MQFPKWLFNMKKENNKKYLYKNVIYSEKSVKQGRKIIKCLSSGMLTLSGLLLLIFTILYIFVKPEMRSISDYLSAIMITAIFFSIHLLFRYMDNRCNRIMKYGTEVKPLEHTGHSPLLFDSSTVDASDECKQNHMKMLEVWTMMNGGFDNIKFRKSKKLRNNEYSTRKCIEDYYRMGQSRDISARKMHYKNFVEAYMAKYEEVYYDFFCNALGRELYTFSFTWEDYDAFSPKIDELYIEYMQKLIGGGEIQ